MNTCSKRHGSRLCVLTGVVVVSLLLLAWGIMAKSRSVHASPANLPLSGLLAMQPESLRNVDIAKMNLLCAQGLPGAERLDIPACLRTLDQWTEHVRSETQRHWYRFEQNPAEFEHSEGFFRMLMLTVVLEEDFRVRYDPDRSISPQNASSSDDFFADSSDVFLHGLLGSKRQGTCSSMPVLTVAVGRRLGYPLKLVTTKGHLFVRWDGSKERFNAEATSRGLNRFEDDYYRRWPFPVTDEEVEQEGYLKSLTAAEELGVFLSIRGMCQRQAGQIAEAAQSFAEAVRLSPGCASYRMMKEELDMALNQNIQLAIQSNKP